MKCKNCIIFVVCLLFLVVFITSCGKKEEIIPTTVEVIETTEEVTTQTEEITTEEETIEYVETTEEAIEYYNDNYYYEDYEYNNVDYYVYDNTDVLNSYNGVVYYNGHKETYYSQQVLPGDGLNIPGRYVAEDGTVRDENGYICVAADPSYLPYGSIVETSLGTGKVYDSGCDYGTIDIYTDW